MNTLQHIHTNTACCLEEDRRRTSRHPIASTGTRW